MAKWILLLSVLYSTWSLSQETKLSESIISIAEEIAASESDPDDASAYIERFYELAENPVNLNNAAVEELSRLFFLSDFQVKALADYTHSTGKIISYYELANIPGFDKETAEMIIPFITLNNDPPKNSDSVRWKNVLLTNFSVRSGTDDTTLSGSPYKVLTKFKFNTGSFSGGFIMEKDAGEELLDHGTLLPDFLSANIAYSGKGLVRKFIIGDYSVRLGQGTNINTGIRTGLSVTSPGYMSASDQIKPYTSTDENNFFRGLATGLSVKNLAIFIFYSKNKIDATLGSSSGLAKDQVENLYTSGIHNRSTLLSKKDAISEMVYGINLSYNFKNVRLGIAWSEDRFSLPVNSTDPDPEYIFRFRGDRNSIYSIYYNSLIKRILLYGEISMNENHYRAVVQGVSFRPSDRLIINFLYRNYDPGYITFHGKGPGQGSKTNNECGLLGNFTFEAAKHLFISGGCDVQYFPWLKYRCSSPSRGVKKELRVRFLPSDKLSIDGLFNYRLAETDTYNSVGIPGLNKLISESYKLSVRYSPNNNLTLGTRFDYKIVDPSGSKGTVMMQDINYRFTQIPVTFWFRYCLFNTDDWDSRIYTYENDLLYGFSMPALSGEGSRSYIMIKWEITHKAEIRLKYGLTSLTETINTIENINEIKFQLKILF